MNLLDSSALIQLAGQEEILQADLIVVNTSGGKDSSVLVHQAVNFARLHGVADRLVFVHATFDEEWKGTEELARRQVKALGDFPFYVRRREIGDGSDSILGYALKRGAFPDSKARWCTSELKRGPISTLITELASGELAKRLGRPVRVVNLLGMRADESSARKKLAVVVRNKRLSNGVREVLNVHAIHHFTLVDVKAYIRLHKIEQHQAYALGMPRLSCVFCVFAPRNILMLAGEHNPELLDRYVQVEKQIGHAFQSRKGTKKEGRKGETIAMPLADIQAALARGERADPAKTANTDWTM